MHRVLKSLEIWLRVKMQETNSKKIYTDFQRTALVGKFVNKVFRTDFYNSFRTAKQKIFLL